MKNLLKTRLLAIGIAFCAVACDPPKSGTIKTPIDSAKNPSDTSQKSVDTAKKTGDTAVKKDSV